MKRTKKIIFILLLSLLLLVTVLRVGRAEPVYSVSESELNDLKYYVALIKHENQNLRNDLLSCKISLQQAEELQLNLEKQLNELINAHKLLWEERGELEMLLKELQESFAQSKQEAETKIRRLVIQRNLGLIMGILLAFL